jgi:hypothetical protein
LIIKLSKNHMENPLERELNDMIKLQNTKQHAEQEYSDNMDSDDLNASMDIDDFESRLKAAKRKPNTSLDSSDDDMPPKPPAQNMSKKSKVSFAEPTNPRSLVDQGISPSSNDPPQYKVGLPPRELNKSKPAKAHIFMFNTPAPPPVEMPAEIQQNNFDSDQLENIFNEATTKISTVPPPLPHPDNFPTHQDPPPKPTPKPQTPNLGPLSPTLLPSQRPPTPSTYQFSGEQKKSHPNISIKNASRLSLTNPLKGLNDSEFTLSKPTIQNYY